MEILIVVLLLLAAGLVFFGMIFIVALNIFDPEKRRKRLLREQARLDYARARGTAHLKMLLELSSA
jgi:hypothetical protein